MKPTRITSIIAAITIMTSATAAENIYITGDATDKGWNLHEPDEMKLAYDEASDLYLWTGNLRQGGAFRFITGGNWYPTYTTTENQTTAVSEGVHPIRLDNEQRPGEPAFKALKGGNYTIGLSLNDMTMTLTANELYGPEICLIGGGSPAGWDTGRAQEFRMTRGDDGRYRWSGLMTDSEGGRFRFLTESGWWPSYTTAQKTDRHEVESGQTYDLKYYDNQPNADNAFSITEPGWYTIEIELIPDDETYDYYEETDFERGRMTITRGEMNLYLVGNAGPAGWNLDSAMGYPLSRGENGHFTWTGDLTAIPNTNATVRFITGYGWYPGLVPDVDGDKDQIIRHGNSYAMRYRQSGGGSFEITESGNYTLDLDVLTATPTLSVTRNGDLTGEPVDPVKPAGKLNICGSALCGVPGGWSQNTDYIKPMTPTGNDDEFSWTGMLYATGGEFKFRDNDHTNGSWDGWVSATPENFDVTEPGTYPIEKTGDGVADSKFVIMTDGLYTVTADISARTMTITPAGADAAETVSADILNSGTRIYDLTGRPAGNDTARLAPGIYIVETAGKLTKTVIK